METWGAKVKVTPTAFVFIGNLKILNLNDFLADTEKIIQIQNISKLPLKRTLWEYAKVNP
jgi:hypothetical protein